MRIKAQDNRHAKIFYGDFDISGVCVEADDGAETTIAADQGMGWAKI